MPIGTARIYHHQHTHYFRKRVNATDAGIAAGVFIGTLPAGAMLLAINTRVNTAFNGTSPSVRVGTTATGTELLSRAGGATGAFSETVPNLTFATDTDLFASVGGTAVTAGQADVVIQYAANNDQ